MKRKTRKLDRNIDEQKAKSTFPSCLDFVTDQRVSLFLSLHYPSGHSLYSRLFYGTTSNIAVHICIDICVQSWNEKCKQDLEHPPNSTEDIVPEETTIEGSHRDGKQRQGSCIFSLARGSEVVRRRGGAREMRHGKSDGN